MTHAGPGDQTSTVDGILNDAINHPSHYNRGKIEVLDFILDRKLDYLRGNIVKYVSRYRFKGTPVNDLKKAQFYLRELIARDADDRSFFCYWRGFGRQERGKISVDDFIEDQQLGSLATSIIRVVVETREWQHAEKAIELLINISTAQTSSAPG